MRGSNNTDEELTALKEEYESAKVRFQEQRETLKEFSNESLKVFRLSVLLVGVPTAIVGAINSRSLGNTLSSLYSTECAVQSFSICLADMSEMTNLVIPTFLLAVVLHVMTSGFEARGIHNETNPHDIHKIRRKKPAATQYYIAKLRTYETRIENNDRVISGIEFILGFAKFLFATAVAGVVTIAYTVVFGRPFEGLWLLVGISILLMANYTFPPSYMRTDAGVPWTFTPHYPTEKQREEVQDKPDNK